MNTYQLSVIEKIIGHRFIKFGTVGFSGTIVNLAVLYLNQEIVFKGIYPVERRLYLSLSVDGVDIPATGE